MLIYNSYEGQVRRVIKRIKESSRPSAQDCHGEECIVFDVAVALSSTEKHPPSKYPILSIHHNSPHRRWFLSLFDAYDLVDTHDWHAILDGDTHIFMKVLDHRRVLDALRNPTKSANTHFL